jgi:SAM-dependent methyltransferase
VQCPCCNGTFSTFLPFGLPQRINAMCPRCGALERDRLLKLYFETNTNLFRDRLRVLHFAPEHWLQKTLKRLPTVDYTSADLYSPNAMVKMDITDIRFADRSFDVVICNHVLEHVPEDRKAMSELCRVLKPGGWAVLQVPIEEERGVTLEDPTIVTPEERQRVFGQHDHVRIYGRDYVERLRNAGFSVKEDAFVRTLNEQMLRRYAPSVENIFFCQKM